MYITELEDAIKEKLKTADEAWFATGLLSPSGLKYFDGIPSIVHIIVGIDLPTPPQVLRQLLEWNHQGKVKFKIYTAKGIFFHPKVYILRHGTSYAAYVGSGNLTNGGWKNNVELFWEVEKNGDCESLIKWFNVHMELSILPDEAFIKKYEERIFRPIEQTNKDHMDRLDDFKGAYDIDYDFYFRKEDFTAFTPERAVNSGGVAKNARRLVNSKMLSLHDRIFPKMMAKGWNLHHHHRHGNIVSSFAHTARNSKILDGMWLYYGKSVPEASSLPYKYPEERSMNNHVRLQIIIQEERIGIWCAIGKGHGSRADRAAFHKKIYKKWQIRKIKSNSIKS